MKSSAEVPSKPDIFGYHDHAEFLRDHVLFLKATEPGFTLRDLSSKSGLATGFLSMVFGKKRVLSAEALHKLIAHLRLSTKEKKVLEILHVIGTTDDPKRRIHAINQLSKLGEFNKRNERGVGSYKYLSKWFYVAIREMVMLDDFKPDFEWIQGRLAARITLAECQEAFEFLVERGFLIATEDGTYKVETRHLDCLDGIFRASLGEFHRQMFELAAHAIEKIPRDHRYIKGHTFSVDRRDVEKIKQIVDEAIDKIMKLGHAAETRDEVYHLEIASFPITRSWLKVGGEE